MLFTRRSSSIHLVAAPMDVSPCFIDKETILNLGAGGGGIKISGRSLYDLWTGVSTSDLTSLATGTSEVEVEDVTSSDFTNIALVVVVVTVVTWLLSEGNRQIKRCPRCLTMIYFKGTVCSLQNFYCERYRFSAKWQS